MGRVLFTKCWIVGLLLSCQIAWGQDILQITLDGSEEGKSLPAFLADFAEAHQARFFVNPEWIQHLRIDRSYAGSTLEAALQDVLQGTNINFFAMYPSVVVIVKDPRQMVERKRVLELARQQDKTIMKLSIGAMGEGRKDPLRLSGQVVDEKTGEPIPGATIQIGDGSGGGTSSDEEGKFLLQLPEGSHALEVAFVGYDPQVVDLAIYSDGTLNIQLHKPAQMLEEVIIQDEAQRDMATSRLGQIRISVRNLKRAPSFLGEADIIKQVQALPGVTTVGEAAMGFNVRGGSVDQNLVLYDGMPVFNSAHVFGFLSAFNTDAVRDVSFYRGGIPAEFGGRVSSVLDIRSKDGDFERWKGSVGIGLLTSSFHLHGPVQKDKSSLAASFRTTYSNWLVQSVRTDYADLRNSRVSFYDGTFKWAQRLADQSRLSITGYASADGFRLMGDTTYQWNQWLASARWDRPVRNGWSSDYTVGASSYGYEVVNDNVRSASRLSYRMLTNLAKVGFHRYEGVHKTHVGAQLSYMLFQPGTLQPGSSISTTRSLRLDNQHSLELALHGADEWILKERLILEGGLRMPVFLSLGPADIQTYTPGLPREQKNVEDTLSVGGAGVIKAYVGVEPRASLRWSLSPLASVKAGYNRMYQFLHLVTNAAAVTPVDIWQPSGYYFRPQRADQLSVGYFKDSKEKKYQASVEVYYKYIANLLDFKDGANLILNSHLETALLQGFGESYGVEVLLAKLQGRLTGSANYTYSRSFRTISGRSTSESINRGEKYPANFDQPHVANVTWRYELSRRYFFTGNFTFHSGRPVTVPLSAFAFENTSVAYFSGRNQYRIPDYHRLDLALVLEGNHKKHQRWKGTWTLSAYNVYARKNPYTVFFRASGAGIPQPYQLSIVGTVVPSLSYTIRFE